MNQSTHLKKKKHEYSTPKIGNQTPTQRMNIQIVKYSGLALPQTQVV